MQQAGVGDVAYICTSLLSLALLPYVAMPIADACSALCRLWPKPKKDTTELENRIATIESQLENLSIFDEFVQYARQKREVAQLRLEIQRMRQEEPCLPSMLRYKVTALVALLLMLVFFHCMVKYYGVAIFQFPAVWFAPFNRLLSFPGTVSTEELTPVSAGFLAGLTFCLIRFTALSFVSL